MSEIEGLLKKIDAGQAAPVYLVVGEEFLARKAAEALIEKLVPRSQWGLNVTVMDAPSPAEVARDLATVAMFPGSKVVWVREPEFLLPKKGRPDALARAREAWLAGRRKDAARRVLALAARAGWGPQELDPASSGAAGLDAWREELGIELAEADLGFLGEVARFCAAEGIAAPEGDARPLEELLDRGLPKGHCLVIEASTVDARLSLFKKLQKLGEVVERKVERELRKLDIHEHVARVLRPFKKRMGREAEELLKSLCGGNMRLLQSELEKLCLYAGERPAIEEGDVRLLVSRAREEEFLELANALQARDLHAALAYVDEAMGQGQHALQILGAVASVLRRLLEDKERYARMRPSPRMGYREFQDSVYPRLAAEAKEEGRKVPHAYVCFLGWQAQARFGREELVEGLLAAGECDLALKRSADPRVTLERLLLRLCAATGLKLN